MKEDTSKSTILVISMGFLVLYVIFSWQWAVFTSLIVGAGGAISRSFSRFIEKAWMKLALVLSYIIPTVLLAIIFYFILFPVSIISKIFTNDPLMLSKKYDSYFVDVDKEIDKESFEKIW